ncbi:prephenate dehydratase [Aureispira anguillae]|uniref:prephenate dehydratase n=1 Tax=Aureispira anguillae TaxID=2864201 RepID=A0A915VKK7_9BACT|nr:prephenate dehydratase [Aureispira anguillae]BDS09665.1 prephenate dehydratase [Aureispira anguillae]
MKHNYYQNSKASAIKKVAIQGIRGAFHEEAARQWFESEAIEIVPTLLFKDMVKAVAAKEIEHAVIAIENTISGTIHQNLRLLSSYPVEICGEISLRIRQNLGVLPGTSLKDLTEVRSHYMAINQCRRYFKEHPQIKLVEDIDTALSAKTIAQQQLKTVGAIGSLQAMDFYGLEVIGRSIETDKHNYTRFFVLAPKSEKRPTEGYNKVTISAVLPHKAGSLNRLLTFFQLEAINLSKLESITIVGQPYRYRFIMDLEFERGYNFENQLEQLQKLTCSYKILGYYNSNNQ